MRHSVRRSVGVPALRSSASRCSPRANSTALTTEPNSIKTPSPIVLTMRAPCSAMIGLAAARCSRKASPVPASSSPI